MPEVRLEGGPVDGLAVHYVRQGRGPSIVLLHGLGGFAESWRGTIDALAKRADVLALDLPGFGLSGKPRTRYDLDFFTRVLHGFLDVTGVGQASLVGHSLGGAVAVAYALTRPARVDRLALVSAVVPGFDYRPSWLYRMATIRGLGEAAALCARRPVYRAALARCFHAPVAGEVDALVDWSYGERTAWDAKAAYLATLRDVREDFAGRAAAYRRVAGTLGLPVLLVHGRQDPVVPAVHCANVSKGFPRASVRWLDACGHFPQLEHADTVNRWLEDFLVARPAPR
jgi:2-hydroxy-6-oxonona-2,4-dienedioate hydrolase